MVSTLNTRFEHDGIAYDIQIEDLAPRKTSLMARVYHSGHLLFQKEIPYADQIKELNESAQKELAIRQLANKYLHVMMQAISKGKIPPP